MELDIEKTNYLLIPLLEEYYALDDVSSIYSSASHIEEKRDLYEVIIDRFKPFSNIADVEKNINILNNTVFLHNKKLKKITNSFTEEMIKKLNPDGFELLELSIPFDDRELKNSYTLALKKYHPDFGGNKNDMKKINNAYLVYNNFLSFENYIKRNGTRASYFNIEDGASWYVMLYSGLMNIYIDIWELDKAYELLTYLLDVGLKDFDLCHKEAWFADRMRYRMEILAQRLTVINKYDISEKLYKKLLACPNFIDKDLKEIITRKKKYRVILMHSIQAKYAFDNNIITSQRYASAIKRFAKQEEKRDLSKKLLVEWLEEKSFVYLPFDKKIQFKTVNDFVPYIYTYANKNIYTTSKEQQNEYYFTFYIGPTTKLIDKYLYVRIHSYIFSLEEYKEKVSYISTIINECQLFAKLYENTPITLAGWKSFLLNKFIDDLLMLQYAEESDYEKSHNELKKKYWNDLSMQDFKDPSDSLLDKTKYQRDNMSYAEIINELEDTYKDHEFFEDMILDLKNIDNLNDWGKKLCCEEFERNFRLAKELLNVALEREYINRDMPVLLDVIKNIASSDVLNDKQWAKEICLNIQSNIGDDIYDLVIFAELITKEKYINDKKWGKEVIRIALDKAKETEDFIFLASIIASTSGLNDKEWAKEICLTAQKTADELFDFIELGNCLSEKDGLNDKEWAKENYILAANECESAGCYNMIAQYVVDNLNDVELSNKIKNMTPKIANMTIVKFTIYGGEDDKNDMTTVQLKNIVEDNSYYELEVLSGQKIEDVLRDIFRNKIFMEEVVYNKWKKILDLNQETIGDKESMLFINELIYEGKTYDKDYEIDIDYGDICFASQMIFDIDNETMMHIRM